MDSSSKRRHSQNTMPEGHTIHRAALDQRKMLVGKALEVSSPQGRFSAGAEELNGQTCTAIEAYGKHLLYHFQLGSALHIHLGLYGQFRTAKTPASDPRGAVRVRLLSPSHVVDINGPNTCEILDQDGLNALINRIGPDVLRADADPEKAWMKIKASRVSIGQLLMDQSVMAGIGNIYRTEILWRQKIHPEVPGKSLDRTAFDLIWKDAVALLQLGVKHNSIITVDKVAKSKTRYRERVNIFAKETCPSCHSEIHKFEMAARRVFSCNRCQAPPKI
jgi:endonuclease VIII